jgi:phage-related minor tail protein
MFKIKMDEGVTKLTEEARKLLEAERAMEAAKKAAAVERRVQDGIEHLLRARRRYNKEAKKITDALAELKKFVDADGNIVDYELYYKAWKELAKTNPLPVIPSPDELD